MKQNNAQNIAQKFIKEAEILIKAVQQEKLREAEDIYEDLAKKYDLGGNLLENDLQNLLFLINSYLTNDGSTTLDEIVNLYLELNNKSLNKKNSKKNSSTIR